MRIVIDLDSTIIDTCRSIINLHNKLNDRKIEFVENYTWNFSPMINSKEELSNLFELFDHKKFYNNNTLVIYDNAIKVINELSVQNEVVICSKHDKLRRPITQKWIYEMFPSVKLVFTDTFDKSVVGECDIILDDKVEALNSMIGYADYRVCYSTYDWNKSYEGLRANNWIEFKQFIDKLEKLDIR